MYGSHSWNLIGKVTHPSVIVSNEGNKSFNDADASSSSSGNVISLAQIFVVIIAIGVTDLIGKWLTGEFILIPIVWGLVSLPIEIVAAIFRSIFK